MPSLPIIKRRLVTEKATLLAEMGKYAFLVNTKATKNEIKKAVKELYKVDAVSVTTINQQPRRTRYRGKETFKKQDKKAIVTLKEGQKIED
jgi:large subunit ribosomal protein L23